MLPRLLASIHSNLNACWAPKKIIQHVLKNLSGQKLTREKYSNQSLCGKVIHFLGVMQL